MESISQFFKQTLVSIVRLYSFFISKLLGNCCRFTPSCSVYTTQAIEKHGSIKGLCLGTWRILKCHPWHQGGKDEVP